MIGHDWGHKFRAMIGTELNGHKLVTNIKFFPLGILCFGFLKHEKPTLVNLNVDGLDF